MNFQSQDAYVEMAKMAPVTLLETVEVQLKAWQEETAAHLVSSPRQMEAFHC